jgi:hypothetical protein
MRLIFHPRVYTDIAKIMEYYEQVATPGLANEFYSELRHFILETTERPESFLIRERDIRRVNLQRFPYHFLFRIVGDAVVFSLSGITKDIHPWGPGGDEVA